MNTLISNPKTTFLLGAGLDILHQESREWMESLAFWRDEVAFFQKLLRIVGPIREDKIAQRDILKGLSKIHLDLFGQLEEDITEHEKFLARLEQSEKGLSDWDYREKHRRLNHRLTIIRRDLVSLKRLVFEYAKNW